MKQTISKNLIIFFIFVLSGGIFMVFDLVKAQSPLSVSLRANPFSGCFSLNSVSLTATVSGKYTGDSIAYFFDCTNDGIWEKIHTTPFTSYTAYYLCDYSLPGTYTAKTRVERLGLTAENTTSINVYSCGSFPPNPSYPYVPSQPNVPNQPNLATLSLSKLVRNLSDGTSWLDSVLADPGETLSFQIQVKNSGSSPFSNLIFKDVLPEKISFVGNLKIDGTTTIGNIISGLNIGNLSANQTKTITFEAKIAGADQFGFGDTQLTNTASVSSGKASVSDTAGIIVQKKAVLGATTNPTTIPTGLTNNLLVDSFLLPLIISLIIIFLFKSHLIKWEEWLDKRKKEYRNYRTQKLLQFKIAKIKTKEFLRRFGIDRGF